MIADLLPQLVLNGLAVGALFALVAVSFMLIYSTAKFFHFTHASILTVTPFIAFFLIRYCRLPVALAAIVALGFAGLLGCLLEWTLYKPLRRRGSSALVLLIASIGSYTAILNILTMIFGNQTLKLRTWEATEGIPVLGARITPVQICTILTAIVLPCLLGIYLRFTRRGRELRAVASDPLLATICGVDSDRLILFCFFVGSAIVGAAGLLIAFDVDFFPNIGDNFLMMGIVAMIVGGARSVTWVAVTGFGLGLLQNLAALVIETKWHAPLAFAFLLLIVVVFRSPRFTNGLSEVS